MKKVVIDRQKCDGIGICESILPNVFEVQEDSSLWVSEEGIEDKQSIRLLEDAEAACPKGAITIVDMD